MDKIKNNKISVCIVLSIIHIIMSIRTVSLIISYAVVLFIGRKLKDNIVL